MRMRKSEMLMRQNDIKTLAFEYEFSFMILTASSIRIQVYSSGEIIGAVVATSPEAAEQAAKLVQISYEDLPVLTTIEVGFSCISYNSA